MNIPKLDRNAAILVGVVGAIDVLAFALLGAPVSFTGYVLIPLGVASMLWSGYSRLSPA